MKATRDFETTNRKKVTILAFVPWYDPYPRGEGSGNSDIMAVYCEKDGIIKYTSLTYTNGDPVFKLIGKGEDKC